MAEECKRNHVPGIIDVHAVISDACRVGRGEDGAEVETLRRVSDALRSLFRAWPIGRGVKIHVQVSIERER
jgi:hypothetical protein